MSDCRPTRIKDPLTLRQIINHSEQEQRPNRIERQLHKMVGIKVSNRRWTNIKQKYNVKSNRQTCISGDIIVKINMKERMKKQQVHEQHERIKTELADKLARPTIVIPQFFEYKKRSMRFLETDSPKAKLFRTQSTQTRSRPQSGDWFNTKIGKKHHFRGNSLQNAMLKMYRQTSQDVIQSVKNNKAYKSPFDWFAKFEQLHPQ